MKNLVRGTIAAMIATVGILGSTMTVYAAPADEVTAYTTEMSAECSNGEEANESTDSESERLHEESMKHAKQEADNVISFFEKIINFFC